MRVFAPLGAGLLLSCTACNREPTNVGHTSDDGAPILLHTHVDFTTSNPMGLIRGATTFSVEFYQRMRLSRIDNGWVYVADDDSPGESAPQDLRGKVSAIGSLNEKSADGSWSIGHVDKQAALIPTSYPSAARCVISLPGEPLRSGEQVQVSVTCAAAAMGVAETHGMRYDGPTKPLIPFAISTFPPIFLNCDANSGTFPTVPADAVVCKLDVTFLTDVATPAANLAAANPAIAAANGIYRGAVTEWRPGGYFSVHYSGHADLPAAGPGTALLTVEAFVWSTAVNDEWHPRHPALAVIGTPTQSPVASTASP